MSTGIVTLGRRANDNLLEMGRSSAGAAVTIAARSERIADFFRDPTSPLDPELATMITEKLLAAGQGAAAAMPLMMTPARLAADWTGAQGKVWHHHLERTAKGNAADAAHSFWQAMAESARINGAFLSAAATAWLAIGEAALRPTHARIAVNARRLGR